MSSGSLQMHCMCWTPCPSPAMWPICMSRSSCLFLNSVLEAAMSSDHSIRPREEHTFC